MDARLLRRSLFVATALALAFAPAVSRGEGVHETDNFVVHAPTQEMAEQIGQAAEEYRHDLAILWLGEPLPGNWSRKCPINVQVGQIGAGGATNFKFSNGEVFGWNMNIQGSMERILDSVLPHEVTHTILACHFRRPLPRWADEGAATLVEHECERRRQVMMLNEVVNSSDRIPLRELLAMMEYPQDMQQTLLLYAEGYSLAEFLVQQKSEEDGRAIYLSFIGTALEHGWETAFREHYDFTGIQEVESQWLDWVLAGSPSLNVDAAGLASTESNDDQIFVAGQSPEADEPAASYTAQGATQTAALTGTGSAGYSPLPPTTRRVRQQQPTLGSRLDAPEPVVTAHPTSPLPGSHSILSAGDGSTNMQDTQMPRPASAPPFARAVTPDDRLQAGGGDLDWGGFPEARSAQ
jgi:hypothetical protein